MTAKRPIGRPTKYKPEYCELIKELAKEGEGVASWAVACGVDKTSLHDWRKQHPDFSTAFNEAKVLEQVWWERQGKNALFADKFQASVWHKSMQARFREDYTETNRTEVTGANGGPVQVQAITIDAKALLPDHREALKQALLAAKGEKDE